MISSSFQAKSIRTFIGAKDYKLSKNFYRDLGFKEIEIEEKMTLFEVNENLGFYLQDYYAKEWVDNSMVFLELDDIEKFESELLSKNLKEKYQEAKISEIKDFDWGRVLFVHDPAGVLWQIGQFV